MGKENLHLYEEFAQILKEQKAATQQEVVDGKLKIAVEKYINVILVMISDSEVVGRMKEMTVKRFFVLLIAEVKAHPKYKKVRAIQITANTAITDRAAVVDLADLEENQVLSIAQIQAVLQR